MTTKTERYLTTTSRPTGQGESGMQCAIGGALLQPVSGAIIYTGLSVYNGMFFVLLGAAVSLAALGFGIWGAITAITNREYTTERRTRTVHTASTAGLWK